MNQSNTVSIQSTIEHILTSVLNSDTLTWLHEKGAAIRVETNAQHLNTAFVMAPRKTGHHIIPSSLQQYPGSSNEGDNHFFIGWTIDRLTRLWILLQVDATDKKRYMQKISNLFKAAEMNELVALYSALPWLHYAEDWQHQCTEGIRSNISTVLEAIMYNNPYPANYLGEASWNQMVLKAFFTDKDVNLIIGLDDRANQSLANILIDYAKERRAASRTVHPQLWRLVSKFIDASNIDVVQIALQSKEENERKAAALACFHSTYVPARELLTAYPNELEAIESNRLHWTNL